MTGELARAVIVAEELERSFPEPQVPLHHRDAFTLLVAVVLSARCTDERVNRVTPALFAAAPTPQALAEMTPEQVRPYIAVCGLADSKAHSLVETARIIVERYNGNVPNTFAELEALPGVGHKTAGVIMNQAFGFPAFPVDTHILRLARRWGLTQHKYPNQVETDLKNIFPEKTWGVVHIRMILWGRTFCPARGCKPKCAICTRLHL